MNDAHDNSHDDKVALAKFSDPKTFECQTPLQELLRGVPKTQRLEIPIPELGHGIHMIPVGVHCHAAADVIDGHQKALDRVVRALKFIADECGQYSDGAKDASLHDKMCNFIEGIAKGALDLQKPDPIIAELDAMKAEINWLDRHCSFVADSEYALGPFKIGELRLLAQAGLTADKEKSGRRE